MKPTCYSSKATHVGALAILIWSTGALFVLGIGNVPMFELQSIMFSISCMVALLKFRSTLFHVMKNTPWKIIVIGCFCIYLNNICFINAIKMAPPEKAELINYLWPIIIIFFSSFIPQENIRVPHYLGACVAFYGIYLLLSENQGFEGFKIKYSAGYILALISATSWAVFTLTIRKYQQNASALMGVYSCFAAIISLVLHFALEQFIIPSKIQVSFILYLGVTTYGFAYYCWDYGLRHGNHRQLYVLTYFIPTLSTLLLILFGFAKFSFTLLISALLVSCGALIASDKFIYHACTFWQKLTMKDSTPTP